MKNQANINGNHNNVDQSERNHVKVHGTGNEVRYKTRDIYIDQRRTEIRAEAAKSGGQAGGEAVIGSAFVSLFAAWLYVRHFYSVVEHLTDGVLLSAAPAVLTLLLVALRAMSNDEDILPARTTDLIVSLLGPAVAVGLVWLTNITAAALPKEIIAAAQAFNVKEFWQYLSEAQRTALWENLVAIVAIGMAACLNLLMSIHTFADELIARPNGGIAARLFGITYKYRPQRALFFQLFFVACASLALSGKGLDFIYQWQDFVRSSLS